MIALILYVVIVASPPLGEAVYKTFIPSQFDALATVTLVGGTVGGYISFAGAHRLLDAGVKGEENLPKVNRSAVTGILLTAVIRFLLFLASFGVIAAGFAVDAANPPASVFQAAAGNVGYKIFGVVMWCAAITSVVGAAYTSVSFLRSFHRVLDKYQKYLIIAFIAFSTVVFVIVGRPVKTLILVGTLNGLILPVGLALILLASRRSKIVGDYRHPVLLQIAGWLVVAVMTVMSINVFLNDWTKIFS
jgi:Mn2+/Fe2+ NRAMP family transporter